MSSKSDQEKRNFTRMRINTPVTFTIEGKTASHEAKCKNISGAGMLLETDQSLELGTKIRLTVPSEQSASHNLNVLAEVVRAKTLANGKLELGIVVKEFTA